MYGPLYLIIFTMDTASALLILQLWLSDIKTQVDQLAKGQQEVSIGFSQMPLVLQKVAICESGGKQHHANKKIVTGSAGEKGMMQIHPVHFSNAKRLGFNLDDPNGNMAYAMWLHEREGLAPWTCARILKLAKK